MVPVDCAVLANVKLAVFWLKVAGTKELKKILIVIYLCHPLKLLIMA